jgi:hypothetical protein
LEADRETPFCLLDRSKWLPAIDLRRAKIGGVEIETGTLFTPERRFGRIVGYSYKAQIDPVAPVTS